MARTARAPVTDAPPIPTPEAPADPALAEFLRQIHWNAFMPAEITNKQAAFLWLPHREAFYGGAAGGGKSRALLMGALQYVDVPGYNALLLRRTFAELSKPGALMDLAARWLRGTAARWDDEKHLWTFPSGATVGFGYVETFRDVYQYDGPEYQYIGWDELTAWPDDKAYRYLFKRLRRLRSMAIPARMRSASNPGGPGHAWVKARFITSDPALTGRIFIPALMTDNPFLDIEDYRRSLAEMDPVTRRQAEAGDWNVEPQGDLFHPERLRLLPRLPEAGVQACVRYWDKAGTEGGGTYTVGLRMSRVDGALYGCEYVVESVVRGQWSAGRRNRLMRQVAGLLRPDEVPEHGVPTDAPSVVIGIEQEPGSGGKESALISVGELAGRTVYTERPTGDKITRARPFAVQMEYGNVGMVEGPWNAAWVDELTPAPHGIYWDQIDTASGAFAHLALLAAPPLPVASAGRMRILPPGWLQGEY